MRDVPQSRVVLHRLSDLAPQPVKWVWPGRIAAGELSLIYGDPSCGKTTIALDITARLTTGREWPDKQDNEPASVLWMSGEDSIRRTLLPRLIAAGADTSKVIVLDRIRDDYADGQVEERLPDLAGDIEHFRAIKASIPDLALIVVDPLSCFVGVNDSNQSHQVRHALLKVHDFCAETDVAVLLIGHNNKTTGGKAQYKASGSLAWIAASRTAFISGEDRDQAGAFVLACAKNNLAPKSLSLRYRVVPSPDNPDVTVVQWDDAPVNVTADELVNDRPLNSKQDEAAVWLGEVLAGGPVLSDNIMAMGAEAGYSSKAASINKLSNYSARLGWIV